MRRGGCRLQSHRFLRASNARFHQVSFHTGTILGHPQKRPTSWTSRSEILTSRVAEHEPNGWYRAYRMTGSRWSLAEACAWAGRRFALEMPHSGCGYTRRRPRGGGCIHIRRRAGSGSGGRTRLRRAASEACPSRAALRLLRAVAAMARGRKRTSGAVGCIWRAPTPQGARAWRGGAEGKTDGGRGCWNGQGGRALIGYKTPGGADVVGLELGLGPCALFRSRLSRSSFPSRRQ